MRMTAENEGKILETAIGRWGVEKQVDKCIEEMAELTKELLKYRLVKDEDAEERLHRILEEIADVQIMINQMQLIYGDASDWEEYKLQKLAKRLGIA